jgi:hypothetical protein
MDRKKDLGESPPTPEVLGALSGYGGSSGTQGLRWKLRAEKSLQGSQNNRVWCVLTQHSAVPKRHGPVHGAPFCSARQKVQSGFSYNPEAAVTKVGSLRQWNMEQGG